MSRGPIIQPTNQSTLPINQSITPSRSKLGQSINQSTFLANQNERFKQKLTPPTFSSFPFCIIRATTCFWSLITQGQHHYSSKWTKKLKDLQGKEKSGRHFVARFNSVLLRDCFQWPFFLSEMRGVVLYPKRGHCGISTIKIVLAFVPLSSFKRKVCLVFGTIAFLLVHGIA